MKERLQASQSNFLIISQLSNLSLFLINFLCNNCNISSTFHIVICLLHFTCVSNCFLLILTKHFILMFEHTLPQDVTLEPSKLA